MILVSLLSASFSLVNPVDSLPRSFSLLPLPLVYYSPETRLAYGVAAAATFRFRRDLVGHSMRTTDSLPAPGRPSKITFGFAYTQNKQLLIYLPFQLFYNHDTYYVNGEAGFYRYSYYFYGVGKLETPGELYSVNFSRIRLNMFRHISQPGQSGKLYAGIRYQYENYQVTHLDPSGLLAKGQIPGGQGSILAGAGLGLFYDSRNSIFFPTQGVVAEVAYLNQRPVWGGNVSFDRYTLDVSTYHRVSQQVSLALNWFLSYTNGQAPFNALSLLGGPKQLRGYYEGRFRDKNAALIQSEVRFTLYKRLGGVAFGAVGLLGDDQSILRTNDPKAAYGIGLRFTMNRQEHLNIRLDYGLGRQSSGIYLTIGEAF